MIYKVIGMVLFAVVAQGCATSTMSLKPLTQEGQKEIFKEGSETVISTKKFLVAVRPSSSTYQSNARSILLFTVLNGTQQEYSFSPENIEITINGKPVKLLSYDELVAEATTRQAMAAIDGMLSSGQSINAENLGDMFYPQSDKSNYYDASGESGYGYGSYIGNLNNAAAVKQLQSAEKAPTQANMTEISNQADKALSVLGSSILKKAVVVPGVWYGGYIEFQNISNFSKPSRVVVKVSIADEEHKFVFANMRVASNKF